MASRDLTRRVHTLEQQLPDGPPDLRLLRELDQAGRDRLRVVLRNVLAGDGPDLRPELTRRAVAHSKAGLSDGEALGAALAELVP